VEPTWTKEKRRDKKVFAENTRGNLGETWGEIKQLSKNRVIWRHFVYVLYFSGS
jgi:hypothetical protein